MKERQMELEYDTIVGIDVYEKDTGIPLCNVESIEPITRFLVRDLVWDTSFEEYGADLPCNQIVILCNVKRGEENSDETKQRIVKLLEAKFGYPLADNNFDCFDYGEATDSCETEC